MVQQQITVEIKGGIRSIAKDDWDGLLRPHDSPFLEHDWIYAMEESKCATMDSGWQPQHLVVKAAKDSAMLAAVPLYLKYHSMGEFIFDQSWAEASFRAGLPYYPKLLVGVPFTPAGGARVLIDPSLDNNTRENIRATVAVFLRKLAMDNNISSVHVNFCRGEEVEAFTAAGFLHRKGLQYHWRNSDRGSVINSDAGSENSAGLIESIDADGIVSRERLEKYRDFDGYLGNFASKRRSKIRRERRSVYEEAGVTVTAYGGENITDEMLNTAFLIYKSTIDKMIYARLYLNPSFFQELAKRFKRNIVLILAEKDGKVVAGTFNVVKAGRFYGRYWGAFERVKNLHFEACYYKAIEFCIENGLDVMEPGAGGGDFKFLRGFDPAVTHSCHFCTHPGLRAAVDSFLKEERESIDEAEEYLMDRSALANRSSRSAAPASSKDMDLGGGRSGGSPT